MIDPRAFVYFDIETVRLEDKFSVFAEKNPKLSDLWLEKHLLKSELDPEELWVTKASLHPEYSKIACISIGIITELKDTIKYKIQAYKESDSSEKELLENINAYFDRLVENNKNLCGYNILQFDVPFMAKRMMINGIIPSKLITQYGKKPWDSKMIDLVDIWKWGNWKEMVKLDLLCTVLGVESTKGDMMGREVGNIYWSDDPDRMERIAKYCNDDVRGTIEVAVKLFNFVQ